MRGMVNIEQSRLIFDSNFESGNLDLVVKINENINKNVTTNKDNKIE